ncbi:GGDEF domain-containing protein [Ferdinandcohnia quinoae]|uniref:Sensor domain-containing diguanylate cyclase n=1 Tax=Fredinandcohnia quinoae TaxID=2918902 RepID=A0AAW5DZ39_9BACI|nr:sensor domain-containing diguanylate cyclase [Fredinandcohnia sp. SECRCQ15]MCH1624584.1 sensor domain-containing diguanylate cyclase [Fredinandcohnia sp. SECRCQ15]
MVMQYIQFILYISVTAIITNYIRFKGNDTFNKWILLISSIVVVAIDGLLFDFLHMKWLVLIFIGVSVVCFKLYGGIVSALVSWYLICLQVEKIDIFLLLNFLLFAAGIVFFIHYITKIRMDGNRWLKQLIGNSKQLNIFREVSYSMQQTLQLQKLLQTILTSVTAGHGLGFNRAMILLMDDEGTKLKGIMGTGPMTADEGFATWDKLTKKRYKLMDLIEIKEIESTDKLLNEQVKKIEISLEESNFLSRTLNSRKPLHIRDIDETDITLVRFAVQFKMNELAVFPLINQGAKVGVLIIDNPVNKRPITAEGIDSVIPLANQAAIAIQHTHLYTKIEDMALKDGLTDLLNQRAFQKLLKEHFPTNNESELSLILIDIDYFKHYNDTNGHLLGNEVLIQLANVLRQSIREMDLAFRFGGEEFVVLLPNTEKLIAIKIAEQIRENVEKTPFPYGENQPKGCLTISLGVASSMGLKTTATFELVDEADKSLYKAKESGKNKVVF